MKSFGYNAFWKLKYNGNGYSAGPGRYLLAGPALTMPVMVLASIGVKTVATALPDPVKSLKNE